MVAGDGPPPYVMPMHPRASGPPPGLLSLVQEAVAPRYSMLREFRRGGMATVVLAREVGPPQREVAIKVLSPEFAVILGPTRFRQEIELLRRLHHPNILPLLDASGEGPLLFYVTPYVAGESLRALIDQHGPLPLDRVLAIARDVAAAMDYAHAQNILHRDIKPDNILLDQDRALVCDFGVARAIERAGAERISSSGLLIGTPEYMSPEQARGLAELDHRSDLYALGCVVYEMLSGEQPFTGPTVQAVIARQIADRPPSIRLVRPQVPEGMEAAVFRALSKEPGERPASGRELVRLLGSSG